MIYYQLYKILIHKLSLPIVKFLRKNKNVKIRHIKIKDFYQIQAQRIHNLYSFIDKKYIEEDYRLYHNNVNQSQSLEIFSEFIVEVIIWLLTCYGIIYYIFRDHTSTCDKKIEAQLKYLEEIVKKMTENSKEKNDYIMLSRGLDNINLPKSDYVTKIDVIYENKIIKKEEIIDIKDNLVTKINAFEGKISLNMIDKQNEHDNK